MVLDVLVVEIWLYSCFALYTGNMCPNGVQRSKGIFQNFDHLSKMIATSGSKLVFRSFRVFWGLFWDFFPSVLEGDSINIVGHGTERAFLGRVNADTGQAGSWQLKLKACASFVRGTCTISLHSQVKYPSPKNTRGSYSGQIDPIGILTRPWLVEHKSPVASLIQTILTLSLL